MTEYEIPRNILILVIKFYCLKRYNGCVPTNVKEIADTDEIKGNMVALVREVVSVCTYVTLKK